MMAVLRKGIKNMLAAICQKVRLSRKWFLSSLPEPFCEAVATFSLSGVIRMIIGSIRKREQCQQDQRKAPADQRTHQCEEERQDQLSGRMAQGSERECLAPLSVEQLGDAGGGGVGHQSLTEEPHHEEATQQEQEAVGRCEQGDGEDQPDEDDQTVPAQWHQVDVTPEEGRRRGRRRSVFLPTHCW